jgi:hypothetical protein
MFFWTKNHHIGPRFESKCGGFGAKCGGFLSKKHKVVAFGKFEFKSGGFMLLTPVWREYQNYCTLERKDKLSLGKFSVALIKIVGYSVSTYLRELVLFLHGIAQCWEYGMATVAESVESQSSR